MSWDAAMRWARAYWVSNGLRVRVYGERDAAGRWVYRVGVFKAAR